MEASDGSPWVFYYVQGEPGESEDVLNAFQVREAGFLK
jgi:hypothetical protein